MNIYITGYTSLLATNIAEYFSSIGHNVTLVGRSTKHLNKRFKFLEIDWDNIESIFYNKINVDLLIHCAGINSENCLLDPSNAIKFNSYLTGRLSELCVLYNVRNFIYFSSIHVYSSDPNGLIGEEDISTNSHPYAYSKYIAEKLIESILHNTKTNYLILRLSNLIATPIFPQTKCWHLLPQSICRNIIKNKVIKLISNPSLKRDFVAMSELNKFLEYFIFNQAKFRSGVYNFASGKTLSIYELAKRFQDLNYKLYEDKVQILFDKKLLKKIDNNFKYSINKIESNGFKINDNLDNEINSLLSYSRKIYLD